MLTFVDSRSSKSITVLGFRIAAMLLSIISFTLTQKKRGCQLSCFLDISWVFNLFDINQLHSISTINRYLRDRAGISVRQHLQYSPSEGDNCGSQIRKGLSTISLLKLHESNETCSLVLATLSLAGVDTVPSSSSSASPVSSLPVSVSSSSACCCYSFAYAYYGGISGSTTANTRSRITSQHIQS